MTLKNIEEVAALNVRFIELSGGNILLIPWLRDAINLCNKKKLYSSLSLSGPMIEKRLAEWGKDWLKAPSLVRFSIDGNDDKGRGKGWYDATVTGLKVAAKVRKKKPTLIVFTLVPGEKGNINRAQFVSVLALARKLKLKIDLNPEFGTVFVGTKDASVEKWANLTDQERIDLNWLRRQREVLKQSTGKIDFILNGGNNTIAPTCKASRSLIVISANNRMICHCYHFPWLVIPLTDGLQAALNSPERLLDLDKAGTHDFCEHCSVWCNLIPSLAYDLDPSLQEQALLGA